MRPVRPAPSSVRTLVALSVVLAVALAALVSPTSSFRVVAVVQAACAVLGAAVLLRRPRAGVLGRSWASWAPWGAVGVVAGFVPLSLVQAGSGSGARQDVPGVTVLVVAVTALGVSTLVPLALDLSVMRAVRSSGRSWVDAAMVALGTSVIVVLAVRASPGLGLRPAGTTTLVLVLVVLVAAVWLRGTRDSTDPAMRRINTAVLVIVGQQAVSLFTPPGAEVLPVLTACASALGPLLLVDAGCRLQVFPPPGLAPVLRPRPGSARVLMTVPFAVAVPATGLLSRVLPGASIPAPLLWGAVAAMTVLALVRAHALVSAAETAAERDALTGLHDRRGFVRAAQDEQHRLGGDARVCLVDLDGFKLVNDRRGHAAGDALLRAIADRLRERLPLSSVVARLGGDELVALVHATSGADAAQQVLDVFGEPFDLGSHGSLRAAASVGVADHAGTLGVDEVLKRADIAMYTAKHEGRGRWVAYAEGQREKVLGASVMLAELRALLTRPGGPARVRAAAPDPSIEDPGHLLLHYQPVIDLVTGDPSGMECFVRWQHPRRGLVPPDDFLPLVESAGLGADVDRWVLRTALEQLAVWDAAAEVSPMRSVAVNLGVSSLRSPTLVFDVEAALDASGCAHDRLLLEITEHDELPFDPVAAQRLLDLRDRGVSIALDDFGNGYSSVGYLRRWPVTAIKLDRSLLPAAGADGAFAAIDDPMELLDGVVALAAALGHDIVAEGVETAEDDRAVRAVGVRYGQGWLYARPMDAEHLLAWWREHAPEPAAPDAPSVMADDHAGAVAP